MSAFVSFLVEHRELVAVIGAILLIASESLPFIKGTEAQGLIHGLALKLGRKADAVSK